MLLCPTASGHINYSSIPTSLLCASAAVFVELSLLTPELLAHFIPLQALFREVTNFISTTLTPRTWPPQRIMKVGAYFDPLNEMELGNTVHTLTVRCPRQSSRWHPSSVARVLKHRSAYTTISDETNHDSKFERADLDYMRTKTFKIKSDIFPVSMRCEHVQATSRCAEACYALVKGQKGARKCSRSDCKGHVYCGAVNEDEEIKMCFGRKGKRLVRISN
jgi:hypothetical protein